MANLPHSFHANVLDIAEDAIISLNAQQKTLFSSTKELSASFGYSADEVINQPLNLLIPSDYHHAHIEHVENFCHSDEKISSNDSKRRCACLAKIRRNLPRRNINLEI